MSRGVIYSLISRGLFVTGSYAIHIYVARLLGPGEYGIFGICLAIITVCYVFLGSGVRQVVSRSVAKYPETSKHLLNRGIIIQLIISGTLGLLIALFSRNIAHIFNDKGLEGPLYVSAIIIVMQSLFFVNMGVLNGLKKFGAENALMSAYCIVKPLAAIILVYLGLGIIGGLSGFLVASLCALLFGTVLTQNIPSEKYRIIKIGDILKGAFPIMLIFGAKTVIMNVDLLAVKLFIANGQYAGYYTSAAAISRLTYWFFVAFGVVVLPFVSSSFHANNIQQTKKYISESLRYSLLAILPIILVLTIYADEIVVLIYGAEYSPATGVMRILVWGISCVGLIYLFSNVMIGIEKEKVMITFASIGIVLAIVSNAILVPRLGTIGGALSTMFSSGTIAVLTYVYIARKLAMRFDIVSTIRVSIALCIVAIVGLSIHAVDSSFILKGILLCIGYILLLYIFKEINVNDIQVVKKLVLNTSSTSVLE